MKIAFISDIHGNFEALTAVLAELDRMRVTEISAWVTWSAIIPRSTNAAMN